ncbi:MAG: sulfatase maturase [Daejeonella sp.]|nr:sulfatase maturase [Daejeonella sp.]
MHIDLYKNIRNRSVDICLPLQTEDYVVQPIADVSPPKWHLGHTTWFFETFILKPYVPKYQEYNPEFNYVFNSYYESIGTRVIRTNRGNLSRPGVNEVYKYREYVDTAMYNFLNNNPLSGELEKLFTLGLQHEQQHQELLFTDIKYILGHNPLFPHYSDTHIGELPKPVIKHAEFINIPEGIYEIGYNDNGFCFDNECNSHKVYLGAYSICSELVNNSEYLNFIESGAYQDFKFWHAEAWDWVKTNQIEAPLYWHKVDDQWFNYTLGGLKLIDLNEPVCHISFYEASAFATWKGYRLPTEGEWEVAAKIFDWGKRWEWTQSAYLPYPGFQKADGAVGEYNGKFMINQMVLRGASEVTSPNHSRITYRNFFHPHLRWQYTGIRLAK